MIIIMVCFGIAMNTVNNLITSATTDTRTEARIAVHELIADSDQTKSYTDTTRQFESFSIIRTTRNLDQTVNTFTIRFEVRDRNDKLLDMYYIIRPKGNED
jgi:hypothetical protein